MGVGYIIAAIICDIVVAIFGFMSEDTWKNTGIASAFLALSIAFFTMALMC